MYKIKIISTGSHGNMNIIDDHIVIDMGVNRKIVREHLPLIDAILISHRHSDHIQMPALRMIRRERPSLLSHLYVNKCTWNLINDCDPSIASRVRNIIDEKSKFVLKTRSGTYSCETYRLDHDVENQGFILMNQDTGETLIHATDTSTMKYAPDRKYDYILAEGNWDENKLYEHLDSGNKDRIFRASRNLRHLSVQDLIRFVQSHSKPTSKVYQLHISGEYGIDAKDVTSDRINALLQPLHR